MPNKPPTKLGRRAHIPCANARSLKALVDVLDGHRTYLGRRCDEELNACCRVLRSPLGGYERHEALCGERLRSLVSAFAWIYVQSDDLTDREVEALWDAQAYIDRLDGLSSSSSPRLTGSGSGSRWLRHHRQAAEEVVARAAAMTTMSTMSAMSTMASSPVMTFGVSGDLR